MFTKLSVDEEIQPVESAVEQKPQQSLISAFIDSSEPDSPVNKADSPKNNVGKFFLRAVYPQSMRKESSTSSSSSESDFSSEDEKMTSSGEKIDDVDAFVKYDVIKQQKKIDAVLQGESIRFIDEDCDATEDCDVVNENGDDAFESEDKKNIEKQNSAGNKN